MNKLDIVMPHLNFEDAQKSIDSLRRNTPEGVINKIIFVNQSDRQITGVDIEIKTPHVGFAKAMNMGLRMSDAEYVMCANDDIVWLNKKWWEGIEQTFNNYSTALCVNPSSVCDPDGAGGTVVMEGFEYKEDYTDEEYERLVHPGCIDGICMWGPVFKREMLDKVPGVIPGKAWFDERFKTGGGEDYDLNRRAYIAGMRCLGTGNSYVWHHWHKTRNINNLNGPLGPHYDGGTWNEKWGGDIDIYGQKGTRDVPLNVMR